MVQRVRTSLRYSFYSLPNCFKIENFQMNQGIKSTFLGHKTCLYNWLQHLSKTWGQNKPIKILKIVSNYIEINLSGPSENLGITVWQSSYFQPVLA